MGHSAELEHASIVLLGSFNPAIFQPAWFAAHALIPGDDQKIPLGVQLGVSHLEITEFTTNDFHLQVLQTRLSLRALNASYYDGLKDLVVGTFRILRHTPIHKMGLNREFHFKMADESEWHEVGHRLAPKECWERVLENPGMASVIIQGKRPDERKGFIRVRVEPSNVVPNGIFVEVNDHYEVTDSEHLAGCGELVEVLANSWTDSLQRAKKIAESVVFSGEEPNDV